LANIVRITIPAGNKKKFGLFFRMFLVIPIFQKIFSYFTHLEKARYFVRPARENEVKKE